ncbi:mitochondrial ribosomal protein L37-domain-containing protein [Geopyxis carbonaria]|nr:mitochondrial ribosomal protein L37-domain-containing protein [Geopyxis carbonaria]
MLARSSARLGHRALLARPYSTADTINSAKPLQTPDGPSSATSTSAAQPFSAPLTPGPVVPDATVVRSSLPGGTRLANINYFKNKNDPVALDDHEYPAWLWTVLDTGKAAGGAADEEVGDIYSKSKKARRIAKKRADKLAALAGANPEKKVPIDEQTVDIPFTTVSDGRHGPSAVAPIKRVVAAIGGVGHGLASETPAGAKAGLMGRKRPTTVEVGHGAEAQVTAELAAAARGEVKKAMRKKGRAKIKENNFLAQM